MADDFNGNSGEGSQLVSDPAPSQANASGKKEIDWGRFGLSEESHAKSYNETTLTGYGGEGGYQQGEGGQKIQELFDEQQVKICCFLHDFNSPVLYRTLIPTCHKHVVVCVTVTLFLFFFSLISIDVYKWFVFLCWRCYLFIHLYYQ